jgi:hypothetical protein
MRIQFDFDFRGREIGLAKGMKIERRETSDSRDVAGPAISPACQTEWNLCGLETSRLGMQLFVKIFANLFFYDSRGVAGNKLKMTLGLPWYVSTVTSPHNKRIFRTRNLEHRT